MARHRKPDEIGQAHASAVDLARVAEALTGLGFDNEAEFDRIVIPAHHYVATVWIDHCAPLALVIDARGRVPLDLDYASQLAEALDMWNQERITPTASYRLTSAGNIEIRLRTATWIKHGLSDGQLDTFLGSSLNALGTFAREFRAEMELDDDHLALPATVMSEQDHQALHGPHPNVRHLSDGESLEVYTVPDEPLIAEYEPIDRFVAEHVTEPLEQLEFSFGLGDDGIVSTAVNGVGFAMCVDGGAYFRITGGWITDFDPQEDFLDLWLACNEYNEVAVGTTAYTRMEDETMLLHVEASVNISDGMALDQRSHFVISALVGILGAMDRLSTQTRGKSIVDWPR
ncbi:YbjN domain-containing protein [Corynebacterium cystitidis]|uniref:Putative sensory transduction regulator n=1 Tax=Corynebacterium cystitidis DSM 20524 TaxID=1121357 RepID=A0A1H9NTB5_9CORY|nr:YbjN domain-containing protein [Corynebacterium cystitidis]WJY82738.1 hypothetical protein CCYS_09120 [Corynebacterium cystitidis DSM 20524]SER39226.1 Putative sensory transduction regulator [Corynebacterium cystitidis DSM 20524]SNV71154.1 Uncharacterised protein [Corynebacterium cystitidis]